MFRTLIRQKYLTDDKTRVAEMFTKDAVNGVKNKQALAFLRGCEGLVAWMKQVEMDGDKAEKLLTQRR